MAIRQQFYLEMPEGSTAWLEFNDVNNRIGDFVIVVAIGGSVFGWVTDGDNTWSGIFGEGETRQVVAGNHRVVAEVMPTGETRYKLPQGLTWAVSYT